MTKRGNEAFALRFLERDPEVLEGLRSQVEGLADFAAKASNLGWADGLPPETGSEEIIERLERTLTEWPAASDGKFGASEAIILATGRPALLIREGEWEMSTVPALRQRLEAARDVLLSNIPRVGRIELLNDPSATFVGTGWMIEEDVLITNRHVALWFGKRRDGRFFFGNTAAGDRFETQVDFLHEHENPEARAVAIEEILFIEESLDYMPDLALLRLRRDELLPEPVVLDDKLPSFQSDVAVIGYPARDFRNDSLLMRNIFKDVYEVKRLSPGKIAGVRIDGTIIEHDCSTLGGNSGSVVLNLANGRAAGLHFAGSFGVSNYAVSCQSIRQKLAEVMPFRISLSAGTATSIRGPVIGFAPSDYVSESEARPSGEGRSTHGVPGSSDGSGYDIAFLGEEVPLPDASTCASAVAPVEGRDDGLLNYTHFSLLMHSTRRLAMFAAVNINGNSLHNIRRRSHVWSPDCRLADQSHQMGEEFHANRLLDRVPFVRHLDAAWGESRAEATKAMDDTFFLTNCSLQHSFCKQSTWSSIEDRILDNLATHDLRITVFTGPLFNESDREYRGVRIPEEYWKVVVIVNEFTRRLSATGYLLSQRDHLKDREFLCEGFRTYQLPVSQVEELSGLGFGALSSFDPMGHLKSVTMRVLESAEHVVL